MYDKKRCIILGIGNILLKDEGFGVHFVRWFEQRWLVPGDVEIIDGGVLGYVLLEPMSRCEHMIIIDVIRTDDAPGSIYRFTREEMENRLPGPTTAHEVTFADVLCKAELMGECPDIVFLCVTPQAYHDMGLELTPLLQDRFADMERLLLKELSLCDVTLERIAHA